jgi:hypothetical protein
MELLPCLVGPEISPKNSLNDSLNVDVKDKADVFRDDPNWVSLQTLLLASWEACSSFLVWVSLCIYKPRLNFPLKASTLNRPTDILQLLHSLQDPSSMQTPQLRLQTSEPISNLALFANLPEMPCRTHKGLRSTELWSAVIRGRELWVREPRLGLLTKHFCCTDRLDFSSLDTGLL